MELGIALEFEKLEESLDDNTNILYPKILCGPVSAIKSQLSNKKIMIIKPSKTGLTKGKLAKKIITHFTNKIEKDMKKWVKLLPLTDILLKLPSGNSILEFED